MADNFNFSEGAGRTGAADEIGGVLYPRVKLDWGADGTANDVDTAAGKALPVQLRDTSGNEIGTSSHPVRTDPTGTTTQPVSAVSLPLPSGAATESTLSAIKTNSDAAVTTIDFDAKIGSLTETAPTTDTASSGLNGRLQRIAQRLTSLIALVPTSLTGSGNFKVAVVEDTTSNKSVNLAQVSGNSISTGNGTAGSGTPRVTISSDSTPHQVAASPETSSLYNGSTALTPKFAKIGAASSGENTLVSAVSSKKIRVLSMMIVASDAVNLYFDNATDGAVFGDSTTKIDLAANGGFVLPFNPLGWFQTGTVNEALRVNLSSATGISGGLTYVEI